MADEGGVSVVNTDGEKTRKVDIFRDTPIRYLGDDHYLVELV